MKYISRDNEDPQYMSLVLANFIGKTPKSAFEDWAYANIDRLSHGKRLEFDSDTFPLLIDKIWAKSYENKEPLSKFLPKIIKLVERSI